jgi:pyruvate/2-oxoglutarate dehydrogenase complex dihydrolipoamide acyltransferase (E2) component
MNIGVELLPFPASRRHTVHFLTAVTGRPMVHLGTEADVTGLLDPDGGSGPSVTAHVVRAVAAVLARYPDARATFHSFPFPLLARTRDVAVKVAFDIEVDGVRTVQSDVLTRADRRTASEIHEWTRATRDRMRAGELRTGVLSAVPTLLGRALFSALTSVPLRHRVMGNVAVTSLAHRRIGAFYSDGGTTVTVGVGRHEKRPIVRDNKIDVREILPLSLSFDHRVIDGGMAADIAGDLTRELEQTGAPRTPRVPPGERESAQPTGSGA